MKKDNQKELALKHLDEIRDMILASKDIEESILDIQEFSKLTRNDIGYIVEITQDPWMHVDFKLMIKR